jgi:IS605 OrfB family transposase
MIITIPVHIKECSDLDFLVNKQKNYSYAYRKIYKYFSKVKNETFINQIKKFYNLNDIEYRSLVSEVSSRKEQVKSNNDNKKVRIQNFEAVIKKLDKKKNKSTQDKRDLYEARAKTKFLKDSLKREITFGGKHTQRELTKLYNKISSINKEEDPTKRKKLSNENQIKIDKLTEEWYEGRILQFYLLGEANQKGNRFMTFDFKNKKLIYKPYKGKKIEISYSCSGNHQRQLENIQKFIDERKIAITLSISTKQVCIAFDTEKISEFFIDDTTLRKQLTEIKNMDATVEEKRKLRHEIKSRYEKEIELRKLEEKISNRYMAVDLNPEYIGYCIMDKGFYGIKKIIDQGFINLSELNENLGLPSTHYKVKKQNNKRRNEIQNAWKRLFEKAAQYRVANFVKEDLSNLGENEAFDSTAGNRKVRNLWHREITQYQIKKRCAKYGIKLIEVNAAYSSFIGNMMYDNFDATNAAMEICRRGMFKFSKGLFYPPVPISTISNTMVRLADHRKVVISPLVAQKINACTDWKELYEIVNSVFRWRWDWELVDQSTYSIFSMDSSKSKVKIFQFTG